MKTGAKTMGLMNTAAAAGKRHHTRVTGIHPEAGATGHMEITGDKGIGTVRVK